ncbi:MAG: sugar phosphate isomerase/epimerase [Planctomycetaceae bacterium]|jgi:sugar phosphate isomerase/epimerase|nr:sugar phosphate isomerase/epimerase [Planctomycetaceae bacterium]
MIVTASTSCIPDTPLGEIFDKLADLEYTNAEIVIGENSVVSLSALDSHFDSVVKVCRMSRHVTPAAFYFDAAPGYPDYAKLFSTVCQLAKAVKVVTVTVHASPNGTPFNEEIDRLRDLARLALPHGVVVGLATEADTMTDTPETLASFCNNVKGLCITLDPSHYIYKLPKPKDYENILPSVAMVRLRDTTAALFQCRVGQGIVDFGRLITLLYKTNYRGVLCVDIKTLPGVDTLSELRKMRFLLESSL